MADSYFSYGPVSTDGDYASWRGGLDGVLGAFDGVSSVVNSASRTVGSIADIRESIARGQSAADDVRFDRQERRQDIALDALKIKRGDNVKLMFAAAAVAVAVVVLN